MTVSTNDDQRTFWTADAGPKWVRCQDAMDQLLQPVLDGVFERANLKPAKSVLDIGSGTGTSTLQAADKVGPAGHATGADISQTMTEHAQSRAKNMPCVTFTLQDVAHHSFDAHSFDAVISRFGVMFFADPVAAFANIKTAMAPGASLTFAAWGQIEKNPYFTTPASIARSVIGAPPKVDPDDPGPFAFRDPDRVIRILQDAGLKNIHCDTQTVLLTPVGPPDTVADLFCEIGPAARALNYFDATADQRSDLTRALAKALKELETQNGILIPAEINFVTASA
ncbi:MAG: methyltransferase domain-containing protein [Sulfitobacter sp.]